MTVPCPCDTPVHCRMADLEGAALSTWLQAGMSCFLTSWLKNWLLAWLCQAAGLSAPVGDTCRATGSFPGERGHAPYIESVVLMVLRPLSYHQEEQSKSRSKKQADPIVGSLLTCRLPLLQSPGTCRKENSNFKRESLSLEAAKEKTL